MASIASIQLKFDIDKYNIFDDLVTANYSEYIIQQLEVATGTTDGAVSFGGVTTADLIWITSDQDISYKLSGGSSLPVDANKFSLLYGIAATSITVTNASGATAIVRIGVAG